MVISSLINWWYMDGWLRQLSDVRRAFAIVADKFSIGLLIKTLFAPFRQISADESASSSGGFVNVLMDKLISRLIGGVVRTIMIIVGVVVLLLLAVVSGLRLIIWLLLPVLPVIGLVLTVLVGAP